MAGFVGEEVGVECDGGGSAKEEGVVEEVGVGDFEGGAERGEPLFEFAGGEVVVAEEEVVDGVGLAAGPTVQGGVGHGGDAGVVGVGEGVPGGAGEGHSGEGRCYHAVFGAGCKPAACTTSVREGSATLPEPKNGNGRGRICRRHWPHRASRFSGGIA